MYYKIQQICCEGPDSALSLQLFVEIYLPMLLSGEIKLPIYFKSFTSSNTPPLTVAFLQCAACLQSHELDLYLVYLEINCCCQLCSFVWISSWEWERRPKSSAMYVSSSPAVSHHTSHLDRTLVAFLVTKLSNKDVFFVCVADISTLFSTLVSSLAEQYSYTIDHSTID